MSDSELRVERRGRTVWLILNRPERRNAISPAMIAAFGRALDEIEADGDVRSVCITAEGDKVFCAGADLAGGLGGETPVDAARNYAALLKRLVSFPKPLLARLNGHCLAGGLGLMLACDIIYAREGVRLGTPEVGVGLFPMMIGALIFRNAQRKKALEMVYTARQIDATQAEHMGLVTRVLAPEDFDRETEATLEAINRNAPRAIALGRQAFALADEMGLDEGLDYLCDKLGEVLATDDAAEGMSAFFEKRQPEWKNR